MKSKLLMLLLVVLMAAASCTEKKTIEIKDTRQLKDSIPEWNSDGKSERDFILYRPNWRKFRLVPWLYSPPTLTILEIFFYGLLLFIILS